MALYSVVAPKNKLAERKALVDCVVTESANLKDNFWLQISLAFCVTLVKKENGAFSRLQNYRVPYLPVVLKQRRFRNRFTQLRGKQFNVLDLNNKEYPPKMFFLCTRKLYSKWKKFFLQFHGLSSYQNDLYRNDWFPGSTYMLCLECFLYPIMSG